MREGDDTHPFGIVASGRVALRLLVPERGATTILTVEPGDVLGWSALVPPYRATSTAVAVEPTRLLEFEVATLRRALREDPALAATVYPACAGGGGAPAGSDPSPAARPLRAGSGTRVRGDGPLPARPGFLPRAELDRLLIAAQDEGRTVIGPIAGTARSSTTRCDRPRTCRGLDR